MHQPTVEERPRVELERRKEEQKVNKLKHMIQMKLKEQSEKSKVPRRIA